MIDKPSMKTIKNKREKELLNRIIEIIKNCLEPEKIILFGSRAENKLLSNNADFDLAIDAEQPSFRIKRKLKEEIEKIAGLYKVDIVYLNNIDKQFENIILNTGKIIYERKI